MRKLLLVFICFLFLSGCFFSNTPINKTKELFKKYQNLDESVLSDLEFTTEGSELKTEKLKEKYMNVMKKQYSDLKYEIIGEEVNGDEAIVTVKISVYDFYKVQKDVLDYRKENIEEFYSDGVYDSVKFTNYKLNKMMEVNDRIEYTISVNLVKKDDKWVTEEIDLTTLDKMHGIYDYENE